MKLVKSIPAQHWLPQENLSDRSHFLSLTDHSPQKWGGGSLCLQLSTPLSSKSPYLFPTLSPSPPSSHPQENWKLFNLHLTWNILKILIPYPQATAYIMVTPVISKIFPNLLLLLCYEGSKIFADLAFAVLSWLKNISRSVAFVVVWWLKNISKSVAFVLLWWLIFFKKYCIIGNLLCKNWVWFCESYLHFLLIDRAHLKSCCSYVMLIYTNKTIHWNQVHVSQSLQS